MTWNRIIRCMPGVFLLFILFFAVPVYADKLSNAMDSDEWWEEADDLLLEKDGTLRRDAEKQVKKAWKKLKAGERGRFRLALKAQQYIEKGFDAALAAQYADDALLTTDYDWLSLNTDDDDVSADQEISDSDQTAVPYTDDTDAVSELIACRSQADLKEIFARILEAEVRPKRMTRLLEEMGQVLQGETKETVIPFALQAEEADWDGAYLLHLIWTPDQSAADTAASLCAMEDDPQRSLLLEAAGMSFSDTDEILQYISSCAQLGAAPSACYPEGVLLSLDLSDLNQHAVSRADIDQTKLLILSRTEKTPRPSEIIIRELADSNNHPDPEDCTVRLETAWMDTIPAECIPSSLEELNTILLMDNQYYVSGTITVESTTTLGKMTGGPSTKEYQTYGAVQVNSCFDWPSQSLLYSFAGHYTAPPEIPEEDKEERNYGFVMVPGMILKYYKADMDLVWAADNMQEHLNVLSQSGWNTAIPSETDRFSAISGSDWTHIIQEFYPGRAGWLNEDQFSVQMKLDRIELNWASFAGTDICDSYYVIFWKVSGGFRYYWQVISPGESTDFTFAAMPGCDYKIGIWQGAQTQPVVDGSMEYYTTEVFFGAESDTATDAGMIAGQPFIQLRHGEETETLEGALDPSVITQDDTEVKFCVPLEPVDGKGKDIRVTYCLLSPEGHIYYSYVDFTMYDAQTVYKFNILDLLKQNSEESGGIISSGNWAAYASIEGVLVGRADFSV
ncbi:MAG: hypothetical protein IJ899_03790 [Blautia sp.]|nr:hypothetical protein [Blautia sp.]